MSERQRAGATFMLLQWNWANRAIRTIAVHSDQLT
jgi:hypothetical protein